MLGLGPASLLRAERAGERVGLAEQCGALAAPFESTRREDLAVLSVLGRAGTVGVPPCHARSV